MALVKKRLLLLIKLVISFGILYYLLTTIPFSDILKSLLAARLNFVLIPILIIPIMVYLAATQMKILTSKQGMSLSLWQIFKINFITHFYGLFLPGYISGGVIRWYKFSKPEGKRAEAFSAILFTRLWDIIIVLVTGIIFWTLDPLASQNIHFGLSLILILVVLLLIYYLFFNEKTASVIKEILGRFTVIPELIYRKGDKLFSSLSQFHSLGFPNLLYVAGLLIAKHMLGILSFYFLALSLGLGVSFINLGWIQTYVYIIVLLPISFSGLGIREGGLIVLLKTYGVASNDSVALSFLLFGMTVFTGIIGGIIEGICVFHPSVDDSR